MTGSESCRTASHRRENDPVGLFLCPVHALIGGMARSFCFVEAPHFDFQGKIAGSSLVTIQSWQRLSVSRTLGPGMST